MGVAGNLGGALLCAIHDATVEKALFEGHRQPLLEPGVRDRLLQQTLAALLHAVRAGDGS